MKQKEFLLVTALILIGTVLSVFGFIEQRSANPMPTKTIYLWKTKTSTLMPSKTAAPLPTTPAPIKTFTPTSTAVSEREFSDDWERVLKIRSNCVDFDELGGIWSIDTDVNDEVSVRRYYDEQLQSIDIPENIEIGRTCPHVIRHNDVWFFGQWTDVSRDIIRYYHGEWITVHVPTNGKNKMDIIASFHLDPFGRLWMGLHECDRWNSCLYMYENSQWQKMQFPFRHVTSISSDEMGNIWVGGRISDGLAVWNNREWNYYDVTNLWGISNEEGESAPSIHTFGVNGNVGIATLKANPLTMIDDTGNIYHLENPAFCTQIVQLTLIEDYDQRIWFTFNMGFLGYYDQVSQKWVKYINTPENNYFMGGTNIYKDKTGRIWFLLVKYNGEEKGLYRLKEDTR